LENFTYEIWEAEFYVNHPNIEVPEDVIDDVDNDMEII